MAEKALAVANNYWHREFGRALRYIYRDFEIISDRKLTVKSSVFSKPACTFTVTKLTKV